MTQIREGGVEIPAVTRSVRSKALGLARTYLEGYPEVFDGRTPKEFVAGLVDLVLFGSRAYTPTPSPEIAEQPMGECERLREVLLAGTQIMTASERVQWIERAKAVLR